MTEASLSKPRCEYIAPWALANEAFPLHLIWKKGEIKYDKIFIDLPEGFKISDTFNILTYHIAPDGVTLTKLITDGYLGLSIISTKTFKESLHTEALNLKFIEDMKVVDTVVFEAGIIRPFLTLEKCPDSITLKDRVDSTSLINLHVRHEGLGKAKITIKVSTKGESTTNTESLFAEVVRRILERHSAIDSSSEDAPLEGDIEVDHEAVANYAIDFAKRIRNGELPTDMDIKNLDEVRKALDDPAHSEHIGKILRSEIERLWISSVLYYLNRHPALDIELARGSTRTIFKSEMKNIAISMLYSDSVGNKYEPLKVNIAIHDQRTKKDKALDVPINFTWTIKPLEGL